MNAAVEVKQGHYLINCQKNLELAYSDEVINLIRGCFDEILASEELLGIVLDLNNRCEWNRSFFRVIAPLIKELNTNKKTFHAIQVPPASLKLMKEVGLEGTIPCLKSFKDVLKTKIAKTTNRTSKVDVNFINPFIEGAVHTLKIQCSMEVAAGQLFMKGQGPEINVGIAGVLSLVSPDFNGSIAISFPEKTFLAIMGNMLGETYETIDKDLEDGAGELLNIIFGHAKAILNNKGYNIQKAIPTIVRGKELAVKHMSNNKTIVLPFESAEGPFHIEIGVDY